MFIISCFLTVALIAMYLGLYELNWFLNVIPYLLLIISILFLVVIVITQVSRRIWGEWMFVAAIVIAILFVAHYFTAADILKFNPGNDGDVFGFFLFFIPLYSVCFVQFIGCGIYEKWLKDKNEIE